MPYTAETPWGKPDSAVRVSPDVIRYDTPSHGGYHVTGSALDRIPAQFRDGFAGYGWFEEDCDWAIVAWFLPELFPAEAQDVARATLEHFKPEVLATEGSE